LVDGGYLILGHAETLWQVSDAFSLVPVGEAFVYRKDSAPVRSRRQPPAPTRTPGLRDVLLSPVRLPRRAAAAPDRARRVRAPSPVDDLASARGALTRGRYEEASSLA
jgi:chemotaxis protein methyltransferase CheR